jgi:hypothetical protein
MDTYKPMEHVSNGRTTATSGSEQLLQQRSRRWTSVWFVVKGLVLAHISRLTEERHFESYTIVNND